MSDHADDLPVIGKISWLGKVAKNDVTEQEIAEAKEVIDADPALVKNGWTPTALAKYFRERKEAQADVVLRRRKTRPTRTNGRYNAHRWRR